ncbi:MFS transporter [Nakamurella sp.]|uniref:MFS transporter n=1 Tax=Nakamurella sp. TaxID=1869182 RepID=UPI003B3B342C
MTSPASVPASVPASGAARSGAGLVLLVLAASQFLMTLDSSVMNVSMATVAADLGTTITGIQTAITLYTLVMATLMITGGKLGSIMGRRRAMGIGMVIYAAGSFVTGISPNLPVLLLGWSFLEGVGAALIMPAIVALVAANFAPEKRSGAYGMVAAASAVAVAAGPLIGGAMTTYLSWRYVFFGEVVIAIAILATLRKLRDTPPVPGRIDYFGSLLSVVGLGLLVYGVLKSSEWGLVVPKPNAPSLFGASLTVWFVGAGLLVVYGFLHWERHLEARQDADPSALPPLVRPSMLGVRQLTGGLSMFFAQFMIQAGVFFSIPLFLSVVLGLSALETGVRLVPLSIALLVAAVGIPKVWPRANPRRVVRFGLLCMIVGIGFLVAGMDPQADAAVVTIPMVLMGLGLGALASQLGAVTVSAVPEDQAAEVGGLQNTATNLGASMGTALIGSVLIATLSTAALTSVASSEVISAPVKAQLTTDLASGVPFISDAQVQAELTAAGVSTTDAQEITAINADARLQALQVAFAAAGLVAILALFLTGRIPVVPPGSPETAEPEPAPPGTAGPA